MLCMNLLLDRVVRLIHEAQVWQGVLRDLSKVPAAGIQDPTVKGTEQVCAS